MKLQEVFDETGKLTAYNLDGHLFEIIYNKYGVPAGYFDGNRYFMRSEQSAPGTFWEITVLGHEEVEECPCPGRKLGHHFCSHMEAVDIFLYNKRHSKELVKV